MSEQKKLYCIISHTHWDREWYLTFEQFRIRLVDMMDHLLEILENDPGYRFHLDAQTVVLEDYLEIRPARRDEIMRYVREGRLLVGPWYVQNDFHLTSGESTVRNLLMGIRIAESFGGCMRVGYAADQFGLCSQLPQILSRVGLDSCVFGRGFARGETQFYWEAEDGSRVLCEHMAAWYNNAQRFPEDPAEALELARECGRQCLEHGRTHACLLMNGVDHLEAQENLTGILRAVQPLLADDEEMFQDTLPEYLARVREEVRERGLTLPVYTGEFRDLGAPNVLTGTLAARVYLKQRNARSQARLEKCFEPLYAAAAMYGVCDYPHDYAAYLWRLLILNHPHDSVCGCSVGAVHDHMMDRFRRLEENLDELISRGEDVLLSHVNRAGLSAEQYLIMAVNPTQLTWRGPLEAEVSVPAAEDTGCYVLADSRGREVPYRIVREERGVNIRLLSPINLPGEMTVNRYTIRFCPGGLPGLSHKTYALTPAATRREPQTVRPRPLRRMENSFLRVSINRNGTIDMTDKATGITHRGLLLLEDNADRGDTYTFCENDGSEIVTNQNLRAAVSRGEDTPELQSRRIRYALNIDRAIGSGRLDVDITLTLRRGDSTLGVVIRVENSCIRHRLRVRIPTGIAADENYAGQPFDVLVRPKVSSYRQDSTHPNTDFCGIDAPDGSHGFAVLQEGLYEYEHMTGEEDGTLALTLLRSVCRITGDFAHEKTMAEGWKTDATCLGTNIFRMALYPYSGDRETAAVAAHAQQFMAMPTAFCRSVDPDKFTGGRPFVQGTKLSAIFRRPLPHADRVIPRDARLFSWDTDSMILSAVKGAEAADGSIIVRLYNSTSGPLDFAFTSRKRLCRASETDLCEQEKRAVPVLSGHRLELHAAPKEILTLRLYIR